MEAKRSSVVATWAIALSLFCLAVAFTSAQQPTLDIHIIAHTHDDVGWLKTVDEYYYGANQSIQNAGVQYILDTVTTALMANPDRKFIYVEIAFFQRWWDEQTDEVKANVRTLVANGQLEFINGGWCMNDEAGAHFEDTTIQMTTGHQFLLQEFGVTPTIGWQIDPFGHANSHAALSALSGFNAIFFARIDYQDYNNRQLTKNLEWVWRPSKSFGASSDIFAHSLYDLTYCYPYDFNFEGGDDPIQTDPRLFNLNVAERAEEFATQMRMRATSYKTNQILVTFGCDFQYQNALINFKNMDKLMAYINANSSLGLNVFYSTPSIYVNAVHATGQAFELKTDDIFPYASGPHSYWTGYFTSRSALKGYVRTRSNFDQATNKLFALSGIPGNNTALLSNISSLTQSLSIAQHHDAVAGTEQQHVCDDYAERLSIGTVAAESVFNVALSNIAGNGTYSPQFSFCPYLNISICPALEPLESGSMIPVVLYNPLAWVRNEYVRLPVNSSSIEVVDSAGIDVVTQFLPSEDPSAQYALVFQAENVPPLGYVIYYLKPSSSEKSVSKPKKVKRAPAPPTISNEFFEISFTNNTMTSVLIKSNNQVFPLEQNWLWYNASNGEDPAGQASGAYVFRPNISTPYPVAENQPTLTIFTGDLVMEARQIWADWVTQVIRLYAGQDWIEIEATVGPIPINDGLGKEIITRYQTALNTNKTWYTDSQGLEYQERIYNYRFTWDLQVYENVSDNYYPVNTAIHLVDVETNDQLGVVVDRSRGGSSLANGQVETMVHRRLLYDDGFGVGEPLNESTIIRTTQNIVIGPSNAGALALERQRAMLLNHPLVVAFGTPDETGILNPVFAPLTGPVPPNVHLQSVELQEDGLYLIRLHHVFAVGDDGNLSYPVEVDLASLFVGLQPIELTEMTLTANQPLANLSRLQFNIQNSTNTNAESTEEPSYRRLVQSSDDFVILLQPMDIRTFFVRFELL